MTEIHQQIAQPTSPQDIEVAKLRAQLNDANAMALTALRANGKLGVVIKFLEKSFSCQDHKQVGEQIFKTLRTFDLSSSVQLRIKSGTINMCDQKFNDQVQEFQFLTRLKNKGHIFDFGQHTIINYKSVSLIVYT